MVHQPRRRRARAAAVLLGALVLTAVLIGRVNGDGPLAQLPARAATGEAPLDTSLLDDRTAPVFAALNRARADAGMPALDLDGALVDDALDDACAIARGDVALGDEATQPDGGGLRGNVGLVVDDDPAAGALAMHQWWAATREHRRDRMDPTMAHYGIGACADGDRTYYVERLTP